MNVLPIGMHVHVEHALCPWRPEEGIRSLELELQAVVSCPVSAGC